jgi:Fe-S-cluster containining protein
MCFSNILFFGVLSQTIAEREKNNDLKKHFLNQKPNAGYPTFAKPKRLKKKANKSVEKNEFCFVHVFHVFHFVFFAISFHILSCLFMSCIFLLLKRTEHYQSRPLACRPTTT